MLTARGATGYFGWQDEPRIEQLKDSSRAPPRRPRRSSSPSRSSSSRSKPPPRTAGQYQSPAWCAKNVTGLVPVNAGVPVLWNEEELKPEASCCASCCSAWRPMLPVLLVVSVVVFQR